MATLSRDDGTLVRSGAIAGAASAFAFATVHHLLISDIWFSLLPMAAAGAACGACLAWSYGRLFARRSLGVWLRYNLLYVALLALLGAVSIAVFEPTTTIAELIEADGPPSELIASAMPLTVLFTLLAAGLLSALWARSLGAALSVLVTCVVLVLLLGLNVSVLGLVHVPRGSAYLVAQTFGLIAFLAAAYAGVFLLLQRRATDGAHPPSSVRSN